MNSFVHAGGVLFGFSHRNNGQFVAMDARSGKVLWTSEGRQGENAAMLHTGSHILALTNNATLILMKADPNAYSVVKTYTVADSPTWAHPVPVEGGILVKDKNHLALWKF
jgi:hypothetical protein